MPVSSEAPKEQEQQQLPCPRCESNNTKFCYYNNYNSAQPRYFCKACRRYWTQGGALRNIPVGGGTRKSSNKRTRTIPNQVQHSTAYTPLPPHGSFTSLLNSQVVCPEFVGLGFLENMGFGWPSLMNGGSGWQAENECSTWQLGHLTIPSVPTECLK